MRADEFDKRIRWWGHHWVVACLHRFPLTKILPALSQERLRASPSWIFPISSILNPNPTTLGRHATQSWRFGNVYRDHAKTGQAEDAAVYKVQVKWDYLFVGRIIRDNCRELVFGSRVARYLWKKKRYEASYSDNIR